MEEWKDYYRVLQVHHQAEPEVIEGAFKRLAKKYHPDVCEAQYSGDMMKAINEAYAVLRDPVKRQSFHGVWMRKHSTIIEDRTASAASAQLIESAQRVLVDYLRGIQNRDFEFAYGQISTLDKARISLEEFIQWQESVSIVFSILEFESRFYQEQSNQMVEGRFFKDVAEFKVKIIEKNVIMDRKEKGEFLRKTVLENDIWRVFLGYKEVRTFTEKFHRLAGLLTVKSVVKELEETQSKLDHATGLLNQRGFFERAENELARYNRYRQTFTLIKCEIDTVKLQEGCKDFAIGSLAQLISGELRQLDTVARWDEHNLIILLPQSDLQAGLCVAQKLRNKLMTHFLYRRHHRLQFTSSFGVVENASVCLDPSLRRVHRCLEIAKKHGPHKIASANGIL